MKAQARVAAMRHGIQARGSHPPQEHSHGSVATRLSISAQIRALLYAEDPSAPREIVLAAYFDRPPEAIESDAQRSPERLELGDLAELGVVGPEHEADLLGSVGPVLELLGLNPMLRDGASPEVRDALLDAAAVIELRRNGPYAFDHSGVRRLLQCLWFLTWHGRSPEDRARAKDRWTWIMNSMSPDLRLSKQRADAVAVARAVIEAQRTLDSEWRRCRHTPALVAALRDAFKDWPAEHFDSLRAAVRRRDRRDARRALHTAIGARFRLKAGSIPAILAEGRRRLSLLERAEQGLRRYEAYRQKGRQEIPEAYPPSHPPA